MFLAYSMRDRHIAEPILHLLRRYRPVAAVDNDFLNREFGLQSLFGLITSMLDASDEMLVVWTQHAEASVWVNQEIQYFQSNRPNRPVILLRFDDAPIPRSLWQIQHVDLTGPNLSVEAALQQQLRSLLGSPAPTSAPPKRDVFISYSRRDAAALERTAALIRECSYNPRIDVDFVEDDESFGEDIVRKIQECRLFCFLSSQASNASRHCKREVVIADNYGLPLVWIRLDQSSLNTRFQYFLADVPPWQESGGAALCAYLREQVEKQSR